MQGMIVCLANKYYNKDKKLLQSEYRGLIKKEYLMIILGYILLFLPQHVCIPRRGFSNEYRQHMFYGELEKIKLSQNCPKILPLECADLLVHPGSLIGAVAPHPHVRKVPVISITFQLHLGLG